MEKIRALILPDEFATLKVTKSTLEFIRLEGDLRDRCRLPRVLARLDSQQLNLAGFPNVLKVRAAEAKDDFPTRHSWNSYFRDAKHMNELKAGERPDTIHITGLPVKWFIEDDANVPSESLITKIFKKWGTLRRVDVPAADPYRSRMRLGNNIHKFSYEDGIFFDVYVQYVEYMDFVRAMDALRGMKLLKKDDQNSLTATIKVDFDKTKHLSDNSVSHREFERKRLIAQDNLAAEKLRKREEEEKKRQEEQKKKEEADSIAKVNRQRKREEKRKRKALTKFRKQEEDKVSMKIAREEQKLIKAQRQLESIRLLDELFDRIKTKVERKEIKLDQNVNTEKKNEKKNDQTSENTKKIDSENDKKNKEKQIKKKKTKKEKKKKKKQKKIQKKRKKDDSDSNSSTEKESDADKNANKKKLKSVLIQNNSATSSTGIVSTASLPYDYSDSISMSRIPILPSMTPFHRLGMSRYSRKLLRSEYPAMSIHSMLPTGRGRRFIPRYENYAMTNPYLYNGEYYEYFTHLVERAKQRESKALDRRKSSRSASRTRKSKSRSASRSRSRRRSSSKSRNRRSKSRSRSRSRRSRSRSHRSRLQSHRSRSRSRRSKSRFRSRSRSHSHRKSANRSASRRRTRTRSNSRTKRKNNRSKSSSRTRRSRSKRKSRSRSRSKSRDRNRYRRRGERSSSVVKVTRAKSRPVSPRRRSRSSSWSMPKSPGRRSCSWSRTASTNNVSEQDMSKTSEKHIQEETTKLAEIQKEGN
ncbi:hypothetical protein P5V15_013972 [Pogonomyrmex californicus]